MIPMSMTHKILARGAGRSYVQTGDFIECDIDFCFAHDPALKYLAEIFYEEFGKDAKVYDPDKIALFQDHLVPAKNAGCRELSVAMAHFAEEQEVKYFYPYGKHYGICHLVMCEQGHVLPNQVILGTDSHSVTYGAFNTFGSGVGLEDMVNVFRVGKLWFRVPEVIEIRIDGELPADVMAKDIILKYIGDYTMAGASGKTMEFVGSTIDAMSAEERMTLCNMSVEAGAKNAIMTLNHTCRAYLERVTGQTEFDTLTTDPGFEYYQRVVYRAEEMRPVVAHPHSPDNVHGIEETKAQHIKVDQVYVGSCTGAKIEDIEAFARTMKGHQPAPGVQLMVVPGSMQVYRHMLTSGLAMQLIDNGAVVESPGCKACYGAHGGVLGDGEICLSTTNRNFKGRMGNPKSFVYLASPIVAAKTAIAGYITD